MAAKVNHPLHRRYRNMIARCYDPRSNSYKSYGGRGIIVCERWLGTDGFWNYVTDLGEQPSVIHSVDRIDNDGNYEPSNIKWSTPQEQIMNRRKLTARSSSGYIGVSWSKKTQKWYAQITSHNIYHGLGSFDDPKEAARAYNDAALKYNGPNANVNEL